MDRDMTGYTPKTGNAVQDILKDRFSEFESAYDSVYSSKYGKFNGSTRLTTGLARISEAVEKFVDCGDYSKGIARIMCTNSDCDHGRSRTSLSFAALGHPCPEILSTVFL